MHFNRLFAAFFIACAVFSCSQEKQPQTLRVATFNVSIEATNYVSRDELAQNPAQSQIVKTLLANGDHPQLKNIAEIIQITRPDVLLLNEFDYIADAKQGIELFIKNYLAVAQGKQTAIDYPYYYIAPVNTGLASEFDFDNNGKKTGFGADAYGFGLYPGQYAMAIISRYPIKQEQVKTLQTFLWKDMPEALKPMDKEGNAWYSEAGWQQFRLSSKSHWDVPVQTDNGVVHIIAAHPTPPTFDGNEDRNGKRNHDEIRLINDYISDAKYIYDDKGAKGGLKANSRFVILGDLNSSADEGDSIKAAINNLLTNSLVNNSCMPESEGGKQQRPDNIFAAQHTAAWGLQVDYALPSKHGFTVEGCGVFWPTKDDSKYNLIESRKASSDHRLVWVDLTLN